MTGHVNDHKLAALQSLLSISGGNIDDLEQAWLISEASAFGHVNEMWRDVFQANGATADQWNTAAKEFLEGAGFSGDINQLWHDYWEAGGGLPVGGPLVFDTFTDTNATLITAHTPDTDTVGGGWSTNIGSGSQPTIQVNEYDTNSGDAGQAFIDSGSSDVVAKADLLSERQTDGNAGVIVRQVDSANMWLAYIGLKSPSSTSLWNMYEITTGGGIVIRVSDTHDISANTFYDIEFTANGTSLTATIDGGDTNNFTSSVHQSETGVGLWHGPQSNIDNFTVTAL